MLYNILKSIEDNDFFVSYEDEQIVSILPSSDKKDTHHFSMLTQRRDRPEFAVWTWDEKEKAASLVEAGIKDPNLAMYKMVENSTFIVNMYKANILEKFKKLYGSIFFRDEEYVFVEDPEVIGSVRGIVSAIKATEEPVNGMVKIWEIVFDKDDNNINHIKVARQSGDIYIMNIFNGEKFADSKPLYNVFSRIVTKAPFAEDRESRSFE